MKSRNITKICHRIDSFVSLFVFFWWNMACTFTCSFKFGFHLEKVFLNYIFKDFSCFVISVEKKYTFGWAGKNYVRSPFSVFYIYYFVCNYFLFFISMYLLLFLNPVLDYLFGRFSNVCYLLGCPQRGLIFVMILFCSSFSNAATPFIVSPCFISVLVSLLELPLYDNNSFLINL